MFKSILRLAGSLAIFFLFSGAASAQSFGAFVGETQGLGTGTEMRPALAVFNGVLYAAWKGVPGDNRMWWSKFDGTKWSPEQQGIGNGTSNGPALAVFGNNLYAAWKGVPGDNRMWWSRFDGTKWSPEQQGVGTGTTDGPSLAVFNNALYAAWKGVPGDNRMWWSKFDGTKWSPEQQGVGTGTSARPAIGVYNNTLYAVWKGVPNDNRMWWSKFDGSSKWLPEQQHPGNTSDAPTVAAFDGYLFAAWKGVPGDTRMWWSAFNGSWTAPVPGVGVGTSTGPSLTPYNNRLAAAWKGVPTDTRMFWSQFALGATAPTASTSPVCAANPGDPVPAEWAGMLDEHNAKRKSNCACPLAWSASKAQAAQTYASKCILDQHSTTGENMADDVYYTTDSAGNVTPRIPAESDAAAYDNTWYCESANYNFTNPVFVGGFTTNCGKPSASNPNPPKVNGHFTQVVWKDSKKVGCGRATCPMQVTVNGKTTTVNGTHWVCQYDPPGNTGTDATTLKNEVSDAICK
jgi:hypothetical protein